jgi:hypothetical protein
VKTVILVPELHYEMARRTALMDLFLQLQRSVAVITSRFLLISAHSAMTII